MANRAEWRSRILRAARAAKHGAIAAAKHADALIGVARREVKTAARHRKARQTLRQASRVLKAAGKAALAAAAAAAVAEVAREIRSGKKGRG
jgi:alkylated DNA nucleotide flippase Atl1